jgi:hypothetical protein
MLGATLALAQKDINRDLAPCEIEGCGSDK